jgi:hypothetical protein
MITSAEARQFVRFGGTGGVHDGDDAAPLDLEEPPLDPSREMVANRGADLEGQDGGDSQRKILATSESQFPRAPSGDERESFVMVAVITPNRDEASKFRRSCLLSLTRCGQEATQTEL